jgi:competence protein ComGC
MDATPLPKRRSMSIRRALTLIELLAILLLLALVVSVLVPARSRDSSGMHAKRLVCRLEPERA